jgi:hypothetical protein
MFEAKSYTFRLSPELAEQATAAAGAFGLGETANLRDVLAQLLARGNAPVAAAPVTETEEYRALLAEHEQLKEQAAAAKTLADELQSSHEALIRQYDELLQSHDEGHEALLQRAEAAEAALQQARAAASLPANAIVLELDSPTAAMVNECCEKLSDASQKYPQLADFAGVTPGVLLVSMFRRYVMERRTEWFFPLAILPPERIAELEQQ